jgi:hypothetical protein
MVMVTIINSAGRGVKDQGTRMNAGYNADFPATRANRANPRPESASICVPFCRLTGWFADPGPILTIVQIKLTGCRNRLNRAATGI